MIGIVDYNVGNIGSVKKKLDRLMIPSFISNKPKELKNASRLILPGVGSFAEGMNQINKLGLREFLDESALRKKIPIMGICLGMQLMGQHSEEGNVLGLKWLDFSVVKFKPSENLKVPHVGWNTIRIKKKNQILNGIVENTEFYFSHSYYASLTNDEDIILETNLGITFPSAVSKENIFGFQFHPEKSHHFGDVIFQNFINY